MRNSMDFFDPKKRKAHNIRLAVGYILITIIVAMATLLVVLITYGYSYNTKTGKVIQNGLVFISSTPVPSTAYINGQSEGQTGLRLILPAAQYRLKLTAPGYYPWTRVFTLRGGRVAHYDYPFLFPTHLTTTNEQVYTATPAMSTGSPNRQWLLVETPGSLTTFDEFDMTSPTTAPKVITLPSDILTPATGPQQLKAIQWSADNQHVLLEHTWSGGNEFIMLDLQSPNQSVNLNATFSQSPSSVRLYNQQYNEYYFYNNVDSTLSLAKLSDQSITPVETQVRAFTTSGTNEMLYVTSVNAPTGYVWVDLRDGSRTYQLRQFPAQSTYLLALAQYNGNLVAAMGTPKIGKTYVYINPETVVNRPSPDNILIPAAILKTMHPTYISFSDSNQFIMTEAANSFAVYDVENNRYYAYTMKAPFDSGQAHAAWMDGDRLTYISDGKVEVFDYNGINSHTLAPSSPGNAAYFDNNYKYLYTIGPAEKLSGKAALLRTSLLAK